jgi:hypothetical protein
MASVFLCSAGQIAPTHCDRSETARQRGRALLRRGPREVSPRCSGGPQSSSGFGVAAARTASARICPDASSGRSRRWRVPPHPSPIARAKSRVRAAGPAAQHHPSEASESRPYGGDHPTFNVA